MKGFSKKALAKVLCLFFVFSAFGGGLLSSGKWLGGGGRPLWVVPSLGGSPGFYKKAS